MYYSLECCNPAGISKAITKAPILLLLYLTISYQNPKSTTSNNTNSTLDWVPELLNNSRYEMKSSQAKLSIVKQKNSIAPLWVWLPEHVSILHISMRRLFLVWTFHTVRLLISRPAYYFIFLVYLIYMQGTCTQEKNTIYQLGQVTGKSLTIFAIRESN